LSADSRGVVFVKGRKGFEMPLTMIILMVGGAIAIVIAVVILVLYIDRVKACLDLLSGCSLSGIKCLFGIG